MRQMSERGNQPQQPQPQPDEQRREADVVKAHAERRAKERLKGQFAQHRRTQEGSETALLRRSAEEKFKAEYNERTRMIEQLLEPIPEEAAADSSRMAGV